MNVNSKQENIEYIKNQSDQPRPYQQTLRVFVAGFFLLILILLLAPVVKQIPMGALVGLMFMVSIGTFDWKSIFPIHRMPLSDAIVMLLTMGVVIATNNLSEGVIAGVIISALVFGWKIAQLRATSRFEHDHERKVYHVTGQLFFGTTSHFLDLFDVTPDPQHVVINMSGSHVWDYSAVVAISKVIQKYKDLDKEVTLVGINDDSRLMIEKVGLASSSGH